VVSPLTLTPKQKPPYIPFPARNEIQKLDIRGVCKYIVNGNKCPWERLSDCPFHHPSPQDIVAARKAYVKERIDRRNASSLDSFQKHSVDGDSTLLFSKKQKSQIFSKWILDKFLPEKLNILDVAGGRGMLSIQLYIDADAIGVSVESTVLDPRSDGLRPTKIQAKSCGHDIGKYGNLKHIQEYFTLELFASNFSFSFLWNDFNLVVGLHPDQATDLIIDSCLLSDPIKSFAVIPCCVFAYENPHRRLKSSKAVCSYEDYIDWLMEKSDKIQKAALPIQGRNILLFCISDTV